MHSAECCKLRNGSLRLSACYFCVRLSVYIKAHLVSINGIWPELLPVILLQLHARSWRIWTYCSGFGLERMKTITEISFRIVITDIDSNQLPSKSNVCAEVGKLYIEETIRPYQDYFCIKMKERVLSSVNWYEQSHLPRKETLVYRALMSATCGSWVRRIVLWPAIREDWEGLFIVIHVFTNAKFASLYTSWS
jgi:hypothetical protein